jgi:hypothetical protein
MFLSVRDQVSHLYRIKGKITVFNILISTFLESRRKDKMFWNEWYKALLEFYLYSHPPESNFDLLLLFPYISTVKNFQMIYLIFLYHDFSPAFWSRESNIYIVFSTFIFKCTSSLLASIKFLSFYLQYLCYLWVESNHQQKPEADVSHSISVPPGFPGPP